MAVARAAHRRDHRDHDGRQGWSHTLFGGGTLLTGSAPPAGLAWDDDDVAGVARDGRVTPSSSPAFGVDACGIRRHFCQAPSNARERPGRERDGYLALWSGLGNCRVADAPPYAVLAVDLVVGMTDSTRSSSAR